MEIGVFYRFPILEGLLGFFIVVSFGIALNRPGMDPGILLVIGSDWSEQFAYYLDYVQLQFQVTVTTSFVVAQFILAFIIPTMIAFNFSMSIQSGLIETALTYPVGRRMLLAVKSFLVILIFGIMTILVPIAVSSAVIPGSKDVAAISLPVAAACIHILYLVLTTMLIAVLSKSAAVTVVGGSGFHLSSLLIGMSIQTPSLHVFLSPVTAATEFVLDSAAVPIEASDIIVMMAALSFISLLSLTIGAILFDRMDV
jgi:hypothetical protein